MARLCWENTLEGTELLAQTQEETFFFFFFLLNCTKNIHNWN